MKERKRKGNGERDAAVNLSFSFRTPSTSRSFPRVILLVQRERKRETAGDRKKTKKLTRLKEKSLTVETRTLEDEIHDTQRKETATALLIERK